MISSELKPACCAAYSNRRLEAFSSEGLMFFGFDMPILLTWSLYYCITMPTNRFASKDFVRLRRPSGRVKLFPLTVKAKNRTNRPRIRSWEADPDVAKLLDLAVSTTGASLKEIVNESLRVHGPAIIKRLLEEREGPRRELESLLAAHMQQEAAEPAKAKRPPAKPTDTRK
jgi:hypothetical protein